jgi:histidine ammonia-lyase
MTDLLEINNNYKRLENWDQFIMNPPELVRIDSDMLEKLSASRAFLNKRINEDKAKIYGVNTGFGSLCNVRITDSEIEQLQDNLVRSHACGMGEVVPDHIIRLIFLLKIVNLSSPHSGVRPELLAKAIEIYNSGANPVIYQQGSLGASGDLAPLAHLGLLIMGEGKVNQNGRVTSGADFLNKKNIKPIQLSAKEGLAILNGTQFSLSYLLWAVCAAKNLWELANRIAAISIDAYHCDYSPFDPLIHGIRPHEGQIKVAEKIRQLLDGSKISHVEANVQDPYSFRCIPQVHGACYQVIDHAGKVAETELNSVTDNPNVFAEEGKVLSGGNFHAQPLAFALDYLALSLAELASISERRIYQLINGDRGLPAFLTPNPGLNSGFMIVQYTAASIVSQNKQLCTPASVDSIVSSKGQEDHVSMAANAATKCYKLVNNLRNVLALELIVACQALDFRRPEKSSFANEKLFNHFREKVSFMPQDREIRKDIESSVSFVNALVGIQNPD